MNLSEISEVSGVDHGYVSRILSGQQSPSIPVARRIARAIGVSLDDLVTLIQERMAGTPQPQ